VQSSLARVIKGVGGLSHSEWRAFVNDRKSVDCHGFIDGDLLEGFLELSQAKMAEVVKGIDITVEKLSRMVEELSRLH